MPTITATARDLSDPLRRHFGHEGFRPGQEQVIDAVLRGDDVLAVMPTGSGKSLGYQLPAVILPATTLVVSPLISLMKDQVDELNRRGIRSAALHSMLAPDRRREALQAARAGQLRLLYVAPERFGSHEFQRLLDELPIARFVVDEAHCVSQWGHDFRPDYRRLRAAAESCRTVDAGRRPPMAAFTATATTEVRDDIVGMLALRAPRVLVAGFDRPNIFPRVHPVADDVEKDACLPSLVRGRRALVYAATRRTAEAAAAVLKAAGIDASAYHAGLDDQARTRVQDAFASGALGVVCATNAFGMGIDRPDVEAVVHYAIPGIGRGLLPGDRARRTRRAGRPRRRCSGIGPMSTSGASSSTAPGGRSLAAPRRIPPRRSAGRISSTGSSIGSLPTRGRRPACARRFFSTSATRRYGRPVAPAATASPTPSTPGSERLSVSSCAALPKLASDSDGGGSSRCSPARPRTCRRASRRGRWRGRCAAIRQICSTAGSRRAPTAH